MPDQTIDVLLENNEIECCHTCDSVRNAYARRGWTLNDVGNVAQCINERDAEKKQYLDGEGCRFYGFILVRISFESK